MSTLSDYHSKLGCLLTQRRPVLLIESTDYEYTEDLIKNILREHDLLQFDEFEEPNDKFAISEINVWDMQYGAFQLFGRAAHEGELLTVLQNFIEDTGRGVKPNKKGILILRGLHYVFTNELHRDYSYIGRIVSLLYEFFRVNEMRAEADKCIIIIESLKIDVPRELRSCITTLEPPLPDDEDIMHELGLDQVTDPSLYAYRPFMPANRRHPYLFKSVFFSASTGLTFKENTKKLLAALKGLSITELRNVLACNEEPFVIGSISLDAFREAKESLVRTSGLLRIENVDSAYHEYVGDIDGLKRYMEQEKTVMDHRSYFNPRMSLPKGILLVGPPGCGKSETTKAIASILGLPLLSMDMGRLMGGIVGESERNFESAIAIAEAAQPCVLRIDEIEKAFAGSNGRDSDASEQTMSRILGFFLTWMQERKSMVYIVATANQLDNLRPEFLRKGRWDEIFYLTYPTADGIMKILDSCIKKYHLAYDDRQKMESMVKDKVKARGKLKISGADLDAMINQIYKSNFKKSPTAPSNMIGTDDMLRQLDRLLASNPDAEIDDEIDKAICQMKIESLMRNMPWRSDTESQVRPLLKSQYDRQNIERQYQARGYKSAADWTE